MLSPPRTPDPEDEDFDFADWDPDEAQWMANQQADLQMLVNIHNPEHMQANENMQDIIDLTEDE